MCHELLCGAMAYSNQIHTCNSAVIFLAFPKSVDTFQDCGYPVPIINYFCII